MDAGGFFSNLQMDRVFGIYYETNDAVKSMGQAM